MTYFILILESYENQIKNSKEQCLCFREETKLLEVLLLLL